MNMKRASRQRGAALIVGLIMLVLITLTVATAFTVSTSNLQSVGNMQTRSEAVAAANRAIEEVAASLLPTAADGTPSMVAPVETVSLVDINNDGKPDYTVKIDPPTCVRVTKAAGGGGGGAAGPGGITGGGSSSGSGLTAVPDQYNSVWDISTNVTDADSGASIAVRQGVRVLLNQAQFEAFCP